ncbi:MAG: hypothetical protein AB7V27_16445 [Candidatus Binatia bacterium]
MNSDRLHAFFAPMVRRAFGQLGFRDPEVAAHITSILAAFARADRLYAVRAADGRPLEHVAEMLEAGMPAAERVEARRDFRKYVGDYTLFMSGIFRAHVSRGGYLDFYVREGTRSYRDVADLDARMYRAGHRLFAELSQHFELYSGALDFLRHAYFANAPGANPFADFLRRIEHWPSLN